MFPSAFPERRTCSAEVVASQSSRFGIIFFGGAIFSEPVHQPLFVCFSTGSPQFFPHFPNRVAPRLVFGNVLNFFVFRNSFVSVAAADPHATQGWQIDESGKTVGAPPRLYPCLLNSPLVQKKFWDILALYDSGGVTYQKQRLQEGRPPRQAMNNKTDIFNGTTMVAIGNVPTENQFIKGEDQVPPELWGWHMKYRKMYEKFYKIKETSQNKFPYNPKDLYPSGINTTRQQFIEYMSAWGEGIWDNANGFFRYGFLEKGGIWVGLVSTRPKPDDPFASVSVKKEWAYECLSVAAAFCAGIPPNIALLLPCAKPWIETYADYASRVQIEQKIKEAEMMWEEDKREGRNQLMGEGQPPAVAGGGGQPPAPVPGRKDAAPQQQQQQPYRTYDSLVPANSWQPGDEPSGRVSGAPQYSRACGSNERMAPPAPAPPPVQKHVPVHQPVQQHVPMHKQPIETRQTQVPTTVHTRRATAQPEPQLALTNFGTTHDGADANFSAMLQDFNSQGQALFTHIEPVFQLKLRLNIDFIKLGSNEAASTLAREDPVVQGRTKKNDFSIFH